MVTMNFKDHDGNGDDDDVDVIVVQDLQKYIIKGTGYCWLFG